MSRSEVVHFDITGPTDELLTELLTKPREMFRVVSGRCRSRLHFDCDDPTVGGLENHIDFVCVDHHGIRALLGHGPLLCVVDRYGRRTLAER